MENWLVDSCYLLKYLGMLFENETLTARVINEALINVKFSMQILHLMQKPLFSVVKTLAFNFLHNSAHKQIAERCHNKNNNWLLTSVDELAVFLGEANT